MFDKLRITILAFGSGRIAAAIGQMAPILPQQQPTRSIKAVNMEKFTEDYAFQHIVQAPRQNVFLFLESIEAIQRWWENPVKGHPHEGGSIEFGFKDSVDCCIMNVDSIHHPSRVQWSVIKDTGYGGEWEDTRIVFELIRIDAESCRLDFWHVGLTPDLLCYDACKSGWDQFLKKMIQVAEEDYHQHTDVVAELKFSDREFADITPGKV